MNFSILMAVYYGDNPAHLREALNSLFSQTLLPAQIVLVKDGPLSPALNETIADLSKDNPALWTIVSLEKNQGLGKALKKGLLYCEYEYVARMDADDISHPQRFELQINFLKAHPEYSVVGTNIFEFSGSTEYILSERKLPEEHSRIREFAKRRCPINHPSVIYRKKDVIEAGSYSDKFGFFEDYQLWANMLVKGFKFYNIQTSLLYFRMDRNATIKKRKGMKYASKELKLANYFKRIGLITWIDYFIWITVRVPIRLLPAGMIHKIYYLFLRR